MSLFAAMKNGETFTFNGTLYRKANDAEYVEVENEMLGNIQISPVVEQHMKPTKPTLSPETAHSIPSSPVEGVGNQSLKYKGTGTGKVVRISDNATILKATDACSNAELADVLAALNHEQVTLTPEVPKVTKAKAAAATAPETPQLTQRISHPIKRDGIKRGEVKATPSVQYHKLTHPVKRP